MNLVFKLGWYFLFDLNKIVYNEKILIHFNKVDLFVNKVDKNHSFYAIGIYVWRHKKNIIVSWF
jgi:hypothetical protein